MSFRIQTDAKKWFKDIDKDHSDEGFATDFDILYFCFIAGITRELKRDAKSEQTNELVDYFPDKFTQRGKLLVALFLTRELKLLGVAITEKRAVHSAISRLIKHNAPSSLSDDGQKEFNKYVFGGYEVLLDWFDDRPRSLEAFLRMFKIKLDAAQAA